MTRILLVSDGYPPAVGGIEVFVETLGRALVEAGHRVAVATLARPGLPDFETIAGIDVHRMRGVTQRLPGAGHDPGQLFHPPAPDPPLVWRLQSLVQSFRPDVIHAHGWMMHSCLPLRRGRAALVVHLHEYGLSCVKKTMTRGTSPCAEGPAVRRCISCATEQYRGASRAGLLTVALRAERPAYRRVDAFIAISTAVADAARPVIPVSGLLATIPTAVADDLASRAQRTPRPGWLPEGPYMLFVGALGPHKGIDVLLRARSRSHSRLPLVVLGAPRSDSPVIDHDGVIVRHNVPHDEVMSCWSHAQLGVVPSVWPEPFGQVAVECQAVGTPVIVSGTGGLVDIVINDVTGVVVPPGDEEALASAIDRLAADPALRARLGCAGQLTAASFSMTSVLPEIEHIYRRSQLLRTGQSERSLV
jgi:glycosyltransferase involved in cell wall biosynthesis